MEVMMNAKPKMETINDQKREERVAGQSLTDWTIGVKAKRVLSGWKLNAEALV